MGAVKGPDSFSTGVVILAAGRSRRMGRPKMLLPWGETTVMGHLIVQWHRLREERTPLPARSSREEGELSRRRQARLPLTPALSPCDREREKTAPAPLKRLKSPDFVANPESGVRQLAVVCANDDEVIVEELDRLGFPAEQRIHNPDSDRGMFSSIQCAARWNRWQAELTHWILVLGDQPHLRERTLRKLLDFAAQHANEVCQPIYNGHRRHPVVIPKSVFLDLANSTAGDLKQFLAPFPSAVCEMDDPGLELDIDQPEDYRRACRTYFGEC